MILPGAALAALIRSSRFFHGEPVGTTTRKGVLKMGATMSKWSSTLMSRARDL